MNYLHAFHAGNFADLVKHSVLLHWLAALMREPTPLTVIDTHAGAGLYDLAGLEARRSAEAAAGVGRLLAQADPPAVWTPLIARVRKFGGPDLQRYPGSPLLVADSLRPSDRYLGFEIRSDEYQRLAARLRGVRGACVENTDGYPAAVERCPPGGPVLVLIDPPYERADDYANVVKTVASLGRRNPRVAALIWAPLKDLETFDGLLRELEDQLAAPLLAAQVRLRPLDNPMRLNGCALVLLGFPEELEPQLAEICAWTAENLGAGGSSKLSHVGRA